MGRLRGMRLWSKLRIEQRSNRRRRRASGRVQAQDGMLVIKSPKSGESLLSLRNFKPQFAASYATTSAALRAAGLWRAEAR